MLDLLRGGQLRAGQARPLLALESREEQIQLAEKAVAAGWSARQIEEMVRPEEAPKPKAPRKPAPEEDPNSAAAAEKLTRRLQTKVEIKRRGAGGSVRIQFHSEEELMRLFDLLMAAGK